MAFYSGKASPFRINQPGAASGPGYTQFGRALYELNIDGICANTAAAKGRVERAHLMLQDRLVKELQLEGISSIEAANAFMPRFISDYNKRFSKEPRNSHNAHRAVRPDEDLGSIFSWRELRKVTKALMLHYERKLYMLADTAIDRGLIGKYLEFFQYHDGRIEIRAVTMRPRQLHVKKLSDEFGQSNCSSLAATVDMSGARIRSHLPIFWDGMPNW